MARRLRGIEAEMKAAGFSSRTISALRGLQITDLETLRTAPWGSAKERAGLAWRLSTLPGFGRRGLAEVEAFRAGKDPRSAAPQGKRYLSVPLDDGELAALDAWIARQSEPVSRPEAMRRLSIVGLKHAGAS